MSNDNATLRPIAWREIDDINKDLDHMEAVKSDPNSPFGPTGPMAVEEGQVLRLTVRVTDPELAQVVLNRSFVSDEGTRIPGLAIDAVTINPSGETNQQLADNLQLIAERLRQDPGLIEKLADPCWQP